MPDANQPTADSPKAQPVRSLDGRGTGAAWLILKVANAVTALEQGQVLEVLGSDPKLMSDLPPVLARHGCRLLEASSCPDGFRFLVDRQRASQPGRPGADRDASHEPPLPRRM